MHGNKKRENKRKEERKEKEMEKTEMSCIDCAVKNCDKMDSKYPEFCLTTHMDEQVLEEAMRCYTEAQNHKVMLAAAAVSYTHLTLPTNSLV